jgi:hypothetical protein
MIFDNISFQGKIIFSVICAGLWLFFRTDKCYEMLPNHSIFPVIFVMVGVYLNYYDPIFLPLFLLLLYCYTRFINN